MVVQVLLNCCAWPCRKRAKSDWDTVEPTPQVGSKWDATPAAGAVEASRWDATPGLGASETPAWGGAGGSRWDATPAAGQAAPTPKRNRWDDATPKQV